MTRRKSDSPNWGGVREGSGRPKLSRAKRTIARQISLPPQCWRWLERQADEHEVSVSKIIRAWVEKHRGV